MSGESNASFARFEQFLRQGPNRSLAAIARLNGVSRAAIHETARRYSWIARAAAWDDAQAISVCPAPERLKEAAAAPITTTTVVSDETRAAERDYLASVELYRGCVEALGKAQMVTARAMTEKARRSVAALLEDDRPLTASQLPAFVSATTALAAAAQQNWSKSIGVDRLLQQMEQALIAVDAEMVDP